MAKISKEVVKSLNEVEESLFDIDDTDDSTDTEDFDIPSDISEPIDDTTDIDDEEDITLDLGDDSDDSDSDDTDSDDIDDDTDSDDTDDDADSDDDKNDNEDSEKCEELPTEPEDILKTPMGKTASRILKTFEDKELYEIANILNSKKTRKCEREQFINALIVLSKYMIMKKLDENLNYKNFKNKL